VCYTFSDSKTFDTPESLECRGIAFGADGQVISRPLHKFFNMGEKPWLTSDELLKRNDIVAIYDKLDGSMIATSYENGKLEYRSKKSYKSDVAKLARDYITIYPNTRIHDFCKVISMVGLTAIFELTHPENQIVLRHSNASMRLLHVRDNVTGEYVMLNPDHNIHQYIALFNIRTVTKYQNMSLIDILAQLDNMKDAEGYVLQFVNGDMVKIKCPWYVRLHRSVSMMRERDIATLALNEELDDIKQHLREIGIDLGQVEEIETKIKNDLVRCEMDVNGIWFSYQHLSRKDFAIKFRSHPLFGLLMQRYSGIDPNYKQWYKMHHLKNEFGLRSLTKATEDANDA
jgi:T4 RnlA family RNA ligase